MIFYRSYIILCLGEIQCLWRLPQNDSVSLVCSQFFRILTRTFAPTFATPFSTKRHAGWTPMITSMPLKKRQSLLAGPLFLRTCSCRGSSFQGISSWRTGLLRTQTFSFAFSLLHWIVFHATLISSRALTVCCSLHTVSTVSFFFCPQVCPWLR